MGAELTKPQTNAVQRPTDETSIESLIGNPPNDGRRDDWQGPESISPGDHALAVAAYSAAVAEDRPATFEHREKWLLALAAIVTGIGPEEGAMKASAAARLIDNHPARAWSRDALKRAAVTFKWWPSGKELAEFLDGENSRSGARRARLHRLARMTPVRSAPEPIAPATPDQIAEVERMAAEVRQRLTGTAQPIPRAAIAVDPLKGDPAARMAALAECAALRQRQAEGSAE